MSAVARPLFLRARHKWSFLTAHPALADFNRLARTKPHDKISRVLGGFCPCAWAALGSQRGDQNLDGQPTAGRKEWVFADIVSGTAVGRTASR